MLQGLVSLLQNPQALLEHGQMILDGQAQAQDILAVFVQKAAPELGVEPDDEKAAEPVLVEPVFTPVIESHGLW
jgi:hypothetical protein